MMNSTMEVIEEEGEEEKRRGVVIEREHMFDKVVTPSDVGKLNRLVIPKQHAEKYFPLDSTNNDKGLLLNFEDCTGKPWRFRYSYWNSSQSYVMTKGWSRFVKDKKLDAGDIVSFHRGVGFKDKLFIDWRRRPDHPHHHHHHHHHPHSLLPHFPSSYHHSSPHGRALVPPPPQPPPTFAVLRSHPYTQPGGGVYPYPQPAGRRLGGSGYYGYGNVVNPYPVTGSLIFLRSSSVAPTTTSTGIHQGGGEVEEEQNVYDSVPVVQGKATAKRLRLFGVNMECTPISHPSHDFDILSSSSSSSIINNHHHHHQHHATSISMGVGPPTANTTTSVPLQLRSFFNGTSSSIPSEKGKSSTSSSSMSLDLDI